MLLINGIRVICPEVRYWKFPDFPVSEGSLMTKIKRAEKICQVAIFLLGKLAFEKDILGTPIPKNCAPAERQTADVR